MPIAAVHISAVAYAQWLHENDSTQPHVPSAAANLSSSNEPSGLLAVQHRVSRLTIQKGLLGGQGRADDALAQVLKPMLSPVLYLPART